jgi:hypothetical protein
LVNSNDFLKEISWSRAIPGNTKENLDKTNERRKVPNPIATRGRLETNNTIGSIEMNISIPISMQ